MKLHFVILNVALQSIKPFCRNFAYQVFIRLIINQCQKITVNEQSCNHFDKIFSCARRKLRRTNKSEYIVHSHERRNAGSITKKRDNESTIMVDKQKFDDIWLKNSSFSCYNLEMYGSPRPLSSAYLQVNSRRILTRKRLMSDETAFCDFECSTTVY